MLMFFKGYQRIKGGFSVKKESKDYPKLGNNTLGNFQCKIYLVEQL